jgi:hypothetical protein
VGSCELGNEPSDCIKFFKILELLSDCWLLKKNSAVPIVMWSKKKYLISVVLVLN